MNANEWRQSDGWIGTKLRSSTWKNAIVTYQNSAEDGRKNLFQDVQDSTGRYEEDTQKEEDK